MGKSTRIANCGLRHSKGRVRRAEVDPLLNDQRSAYGGEEAPNVRVAPGQDHARAVELPEPIGERRDDCRRDPVEGGVGHIVEFRDPVDAHGTGGGAQRE
jgi:hypothetical protein